MKFRYYVKKTNLIKWLARDHLSSDSMNADLIEKASSENLIFVANL